MKSQTARPVQRPKNQRPGRSNKQKQYNKQTAHVEARRDGKPLIFGWGGHLSRSTKERIQRRVTLAVAGTLIFLIIAVIVGYWVNINVIIPGLPITSVNGHQIPQSQYRKLVAFRTQLELNKLNGPQGLIAQRKSLEQQVSDQQKIVSDDTKQVDTLNMQIQKLPAGPSTERSTLTTQVTTLQHTITDTQTKINTLNQQLTTLTQTTIPQEQQNFAVSPLGPDSATWLQDDEIIREWLTTQSKTVQAQVNPSMKTINQAFNDFKANIPTSTSYNKFLSQDNVSDADVQAMVALKLRRDNLQTHLTSLVVSPTYQVLARTMTIDTLPNAQMILQQLKKGGDFAMIAKDDPHSVDADTKAKGGNLNWLARGQYAQSKQAAIVENWLFDPARNLDEISPVLTENGAYHIVQIMNIDGSRPVDPATLQMLKDNALSNWLLIQRAILGSKVAAVDQAKLLDPQNLPPDLPTAAPSQPSTAPGGPTSPTGPTTPGGPTGP